MFARKAQRGIVYLPLSLSWSQVLALGHSAAIPLPPVTWSEGLCACVYNAWEELGGGSHLLRATQTLLVFSSLERSACFQSQGTNMRNQLGAAFGPGDIFLRSPGKTKQKQERSFRHVISLVLSLASHTSPVFSFISPRKRPVLVTQLKLPFSFILGADQL